MDSHLALKKATEHIVDWPEKFQTEDEAKLFDEVIESLKQHDEKKMFGRTLLAG